MSSKNETSHSNQTTTSLNGSDWVLTQTTQKKLGLGPRATQTGEHPYKPSWIDLGSVRVKLDQE